MTLSVYKNNSNVEEELIDHIRILNRNAEKTQLNTKEDWLSQLKILNLHGISTPLKDSNQMKKLNYREIYIVPVFQQKVLGFFRQRKSLTSENNWINGTVIQQKGKLILEKVNRIPSNREEKRLRKIATRAVYALNLDYGVVKVGLYASKPWVIYVNTYDKSDERITALLEHAVADFEDQWDQMIHNWKKNVVLGADPEFVLQKKDGSLVLASNYLPKKGIVGCDLIWTNRDRSQRPLAELRPAPANNVRDLILNLYKSMLVGTQKIKNRDLKWLAGALPIKGYPIGGHIHFSGVQLNSFLLRALDNYLTLPITLLEDKNGIGRRPKYGFLGDFREQFHGGFEYRTPPSWLVSPTMTKGALALAKLIAENYIYLEQDPLENSSVQEAYYTGNKEVLRPIVNRLWHELKGLKDFSLYQKYLLPLEDLMVKGYTWDETIDIRKPWRLPPFHKDEG